MKVLSQGEVLTRVQRLSNERLGIFITHSWVKPHRGASGPVFDETDVARMQLIVEMTEDMAINDEAVPVVLGLLDEVSALRRRMKELDAALSAEGDTVCNALIRRLQELERRN